MVDSWQFVGSTGHTWSSSSADNVSFAYNAGFDDSRCGEGYVYRTIDVPSFGGELVIHASGSIAWASDSIDVLINDVLKKQFLSSGSRTIPINETVKIDVCEHAGTNIKIEVHHNDSNTPTCSYPDHVNNITLTSIRIESIPIPVISSIGTSPYPPKLCEPITFTNVITWNDAGGTGTRKVWWQYTTSTAEYTIESCGNELSWTQFADAQWPKHTFTEEHKDITHVRCIAENMSGVRGCAMIENFSLESTNGFTITLDSSLSRKPLLVWHATKMPWLGLTGDDPNLWFSAYGWVRGTWNSANPDTAYKVGTGDIRNNATPTFDETALGTLFDGNMRDGYDCVVLARDSTTLMEFGIFQEKDIFKIHSGSPTCVHLITTSSDVVTEAVMGPVCDFFGISRGSECSMFWAEFYDPVYVANYISILTTGQDTIGTSRELTAIDHIAFPFSVLGSLPGLSLLPFGAVITNGLEAMSKAGVRFGDTATRSMLDFSMDAGHEISTKDTWHFLDAIGQVTEAHATEIMNALTAGDVNTAETLLRQCAGESKGWWDYHILDDMLRDALPLDTYNWLRTQIGLPAIGAGTVTNTAKQTTLSADDLAKLVDAASDSEVMGVATEAVYKSLIDMPTASATKVEELANILKNSDEIATRVGAKNVPMERFVDSTTKYHDLITDQLGQTKANSWFKNNAEIATKAVDSVDPEAMADIPHSAQDVAAKHGDIVADYCGGHIEPCYSSTSGSIFGSGKVVADDIVDTTADIASSSTSGWFTKGKTYTKARYDATWNWYKNLSKENAEKAAHAMMAASLFFAATVLYTIYKLSDTSNTSPLYNLRMAKMEESYWLCQNAYTANKFDELAAALIIFRKDVTESEKWIEDHKDELEGEETYEQFRRDVEIRRIQIGIFEGRLEDTGSTGFIKCTSNTTFFYVELDGSPAGFSYNTNMVLLSGITTGNHTVKIYREGYSPECSKEITVTDGDTEEIDCDMYVSGTCSPVTDVSIYIDPMSPEEDETISFNGAADSDDAIPADGWEWDFDDDSPNKVGQAVTHAYSSDRIYEVKLTVTNECGSSRYATRNVTVSEEEEPAESTTLQIETPIDEDGNNIDRYWEVEIWVDGKDTACTPPKTLTFGTNVFCDCTSPWNLVECELGSHTVTLKKDGYDDKTISVYLKKDEPKTWYSPIMVKSAAAPTMHTIRFSVPEGSNLYIDGVSLRRLSTVTRISELFKSLRK